MTPRTIAAFAVAVLVAAACARDATETEDVSTEEDAAAAEPATQEQETFTILSGAVSEAADDDVNAFDFYPSEVQVRPGDTLRFENGSGAIPVPHTVTLGSGADVGEAIPPPLAEGVGQVPAAWGLCVAEEPLAPEDTACPGARASDSEPGGGDQNGARASASFPPDSDTVEMPAFAAQGFYNSGIFDPGQSVVMPIAEDAPPGTYSFLCYLHPATMEMTVEVVSADQPVQTQEELDAAAEEAIEADIADGNEVLASVQDADLPDDTVQAGAEQGKAVVTRFFPTQISVPAGTTVTWVNEGNDPHVVSFEEIGPHDPENFGPPTIEPGGDYTGGPAISGVFGNPPFPSTTYALRFPEPGRYTYFCTIHPGMSGVIEAT